MATQVKLQVLAVGEITSGQSRSGQSWNRRVLQVFVDQIAGNHSVYGEKEALEQLQPGFYMGDLAPRAADRGSVEFALTNLKPATPAQKAQA